MALDLSGCIPPDPKYQSPSWHYRDSNCISNMTSPVLSMSHSRTDHGENKRSLRPKPLGQDRSRHTFRYPSSKTPPLQSLPSHFRSDSSLSSYVTPTPFHAADSSTSSLSSGWPIEPLEFDPNHSTFVSSDSSERRASSASVSGATEKVCQFFSNRVRTLAGGAQSRSTQHALAHSGSSLTVDSLAGSSSFAHGDIEQSAWGGSSSRWEPVSPGSQRFLLEPSARSSSECFEQGSQQGLAPPPPLIVHPTSPIPTKSSQLLATSGALLNKSIQNIFGRRRTRVSQRVGGTWGNGDGVSINTSRNHHGKSHSSNSAYERSTTFAIPSEDHRPAQNLPRDGSGVRPSASHSSISTSLGVGLRYPQLGRASCHTSQSSDASILDIKVTQIPSARLLPGLPIGSKAARRLSTGICSISDPSHHSIDAPLRSAGPMTSRFSLSSNSTRESIKHDNLREKKSLNKSYKNQSIKQTDRMISTGSILLSNQNSKSSFIHENLMIKKNDPIIEAESILERNQSFKNIMKCAEKLNQQVKRTDQTEEEEAENEDNEAEEEEDDDDEEIEEMIRNLKKIGAPNRNTNKDENQTERIGNRIGEEEDEIQRKKNETRIEHQKEEEEEEEEEEGENDESDRLSDMTFEAEYSDDEIYYYQDDNDEQQQLTKTIDFPLPSWPTLPATSRSPFQPNPITTTTIPIINDQSFDDDAHQQQQHDYQKPVFSNYHRSLKNKKII